MIFKTPRKAFRVSIAGFIISTRKMTFTLRLKCVGKALLIDSNSRLAAYHGIEGLMFTEDVKPK